MKVVVKPFDHSPELQRGIDRLRTLVFPNMPEAYDVERHHSIWRWLESHPLAKDHMHRWALVTQEDEVVGHLAAMPQAYRINGQRVIAHTPADYQVLPRYGFQALSLMRRFFRTAENCIAIDMLPTVIAVETRLGAEVVGEMQYEAKLLDVSRLPVPRIPGPIARFLNLKEELVHMDEDLSMGGIEVHENVLQPKHPRAPFPAPVKRLMNEGLRVVDKALVGAFGGKLKVEVLEGFDESFDALFEKIAAVTSCVPEKDAAFLRWRYGPDSPAYPVTVLGVRGREGLLGYAVLGITEKDREGYPLDLVTLPGRSDVARALLGGTVRSFRRAKVPIIRYRYLDSPVTPRPEDLRRFGFYPRKGRRNVLLVKFKDQALHEAAKDLSNWTYSIGDGEATFWFR
ncbi:MAG: GNAT family N-acetyltransferase [Actinobacteria bacterium]|nr:GNAT family N-acetyltransferase [Actinomycetota bacterium]